MCIGIRDLEGGKDQKTKVNNLSLIRIYGEMYSEFFYERDSHIELQYGDREGGCSRNYGLIMSLVES